jgi:hypothetical protein
MPNDFLQGIATGRAVGDSLEPLFQAMRQRRTDEIANELMAAQGLQGTGGVEALKLQVAMDDAMAKRSAAKQRGELDGAQLDYTRARTAAVNRPKVDGAKVYHEQIGGVTRYDPATGRATYVRPEGMPPSQPKPQPVDPFERDRWQAHLSGYHAQKRALESELARTEPDLRALAEETGNDFEVLASGTKVTRADGQRKETPEGEWALIHTPGGIVQIPWGTFETARPKFAAWKMARQKLAEMKEPEPPRRQALPDSSTPPQIDPSEAAEALTWAQQNPQDPRAAAIVKALGGQTP